MGGLRLLALVVVTVAVVHQWAVGGGGVLGNFVFEVENKFKAGGERERTLSALKQHDARRHGRMMASIDLELGGNGHPSATGYVLFFFSFLIVYSSYTFYCSSTFARGYISCILFRDVIL